MPDTTFGPQGWTPDRLGNLVGKTYLITGANAGAGFQAARTLLNKGAKVVMLNRSAEKSRAAVADLMTEFGDQADVSFIRMDLAALASVRQAAADVLKSVPRIDALICNAAIAQVPTQRLTVDGHESMLGTNHYGHFLLCGLLFERIEASKGRLVVVSSLGYNMGIKTIQFEDMNWDRNYHQNRTYSQSKLAQMMFAYELQRRIEAAGKSVEVHVCHPGASRTNLLKDTASTFNKLVWSVLSRLVAQTAEKGSWPEVMCATEAGLKSKTFYGPTKRADTVGPVDECALQDLALDRQAAAKLWTLSEEKTSSSWSP